MAVLPFTGANQIQTMKMMELFNKYIRTDIDSNELLSNSVEYSCFFFFCFFSSHKTQTSAQQKQKQKSKFRHKIVSQKDILK